MEKEIIEHKQFVGERPLYGRSNLEVVDCTFSDGESPIKECSDIKLSKCTFAWKYPIWYSRNIEVKDCVWQEMGRAGVWYSDNLVFDNVHIEAPKNFRRCNKLFWKRINRNCPMD